MATKNVILKDSSSNELRPETSLTQVKDASGNDLFTQSSGVISTTSGNSFNGASINDASIGVGKFDTTVQNGVNLAIDEYEKSLNLFDFNHWENLEVRSYVLDIKGNGTYTISASQTVYDFAVANWENGAYTNVHDHTNKDITKFTFTIDNYSPSLKYYCLIRVQVGSDYPYDADLSGYNIMLNEGATALPYRVYVGPIAHTSDCLLQNIRDKQGNLRFVEGAINYTGSNQAVHITYGKWSLSGSHLMIVVAGALDAEATIGQYELGCDTINLPQWILDKIYPITSSFVSYGEFKTTTSGYLPTSNAFNIYLNKSDNKLTVNNLYGVTIGASNEYFRIQFDLLIDAE